MGELSDSSSARQTRMRQAFERRPRAHTSIDILPSFIQCFSFLSAPRLAATSFGLYQGRLWASGSATGSHIR